MTTVMTHERGVHEMGPAVIALGVFDGVHLGHQSLIADTMALARERGCASCVLTFDRDPDQVIMPDDAAPQLTSLADKIALIAEVGPDAILVVPFDEWLASLSPADFCIDVLLDASEPVACMVGYDFRFGVGASGDAGTLRSLGDTLDFEVVTHPLVHVCGEPVTSTRIRALVASGDVAGAMALLGRPHRVAGFVARGRGLGRTLGAPTANLRVDPRMAVPAPGVYAAWARVASGTYAAAVSIGVAPTFPDSASAIEAHLIGLDDDLYDAPIALEFIDRIRDQRAFPSEEELSGAIAADISTITERLKATS